LNHTEARVTGHFNLAQRLDVLALEYNMTLAQVTRAFRQWTKRFGKNYTESEEQARVPPSLANQTCWRIGRPFRFSM
jgi:hypothetical protein